MVPPRAHRPPAAGPDRAHPRNQSRGERDAYAVHYTNLVTALEGVEDWLVFGRMETTDRKSVV